MARSRSGVRPHPQPLPSRGRGVANGADSPSPLRGEVRGGGEHHQKLQETFPSLKLHDQLIHRQARSRLAAMRLTVALRSARSTFSIFIASTIASG